MVKVARVPALNITHCRAKSGELPFDEHLEIGAIETIDEAPPNMLADGFEVPATGLAARVVNDQSGMGVPPSRP